MANDHFIIAHVPDSHGTDYILQQFSFLANGHADIVIHSGDIIDEAKTGTGCGYLDNNQIPYLVVPGNHDYSSFNPTRITTASFQANFPQSRYRARPWWNGGFFDEFGSENIYLLRDFLGEGYIFIGLEFGPRNEVLSWLDNLLTIHNDRKAIIFTHSYLSHGGVRCGDPYQATGYNPHGYIDENVNDGEEMYQKVIKEHNNVILVTSGHDLSNGLSARRVDLSHNGGQICNQMFTNYQSTTNAGSGRMRFYAVYPETNEIVAQSYSPVLDNYLTDDTNNFIIDYLDLGGFMSLQLSVNVRNARLDAIESAIGASAILRIRTGSAPANCASADSGDVIATLTLPADWMNDASGGSKSMSGTWQDASADGAGVAGHFRIYDSGGTVCHMQGTITATGGGGDMTLDNINIASGQTINITSFNLTDGNL